MHGDYPSACTLAVVGKFGVGARQGQCESRPLPPLQNPNDARTPAKELFGRKTTPASLAARTIGFYSRGCLAGAQALPVDGDTWQVMRQSRNRNWGHPNLVQFLERLGDQAHKIGWRGLLVGDMAQPRGGPMRTGHFSHQVGLDADIWLTPMPERRLSREEREEMMSTVVVAQDGKDVDPKVWTPAHAAIIKAAAKDPQVSRIFANAAIKKALCRSAGRDRAWLRKVRVWYGHDYHFHVRISARRTVPAVRRSRRLWETMAAAAGTSISGSATRPCIRSRRRRSLHSEWPISPLPAAKCCWHLSPLPLHRSPHCFQGQRCAKRNRVEKALNDRCALLYVSGRFHT